ncbi:hypothetical protein NQZ68_013343 [Dissostichus eleginoides]|nr:hypothetical protein NQZ68_013343 [Dissostichus eleginoides]
MDASSVSVLWYRRSKPLGKVRRRVQDLRIPSSCSDFMASRPPLDLSHNESARLAVDCLLSRGLEGYREMLRAEEEVDFLSELEKGYILENGRDGHTADPGACDDGDEVETLSSGSQSPTACSSEDSTVVGLDLSPKDVRRTGSVLDEPIAELFFQSGSPAGSMKDLVRGFIRKAAMALAIVMDTFSDVELLCDLLEASRKRNVSVHLLLDHLNLNLFLSMWQDLKLDSKNFPKLSVRSVEGQTYCARTGRKLTGQVSESFIITDWSEVLTGSYSFSWLSWQVHRTLAVLVRGSAVRPVHQEFLRLHSSSKPIPGFISFITVPLLLPLYQTLQASQNAELKSSTPTAPCHSAPKGKSQNPHIKVKTLVSCNPQSTDLECSKATPQRAGESTHMHQKWTQLYPKPLVNPGALQSAHHGMVKHTVGEHKTNVEKHQIQSHSSPLSPTHVSYVQSQLTSLTITTTTEQNAERSNPRHTASPTYREFRTASDRPTLRTNQQHHNDRFLFRQRNGETMRLEGMAAGPERQRQQWNCNFKPQVDFLSDNPKVLPPSTSQQKPAKTGPWFPLTHTREHTSRLQTEVSSLEHRRQDQTQRHHQVSFESHPTAEALSPKPRLDSQLFSPPPFSTSQVPSHNELDTPEQHWKTQTCGPPQLPPHHLQDRQTWGLEDISQ